MKELIVTDGTKPDIGTGEFEPQRFKKRLGTKLMGFDANLSLLD